MVKNSTLVAMAFALIVICALATFANKIVHVMPIIDEYESIDFTDSQGYNSGSEKLEHIKSQMDKAMPELYEFMTWFLVMVIVMLIVCTIIGIKEKKKKFFFNP